MLFGVPLKRGEHVVASAMVENLTATAYPRARVRLVMSFTPAGRPWPLFSASPWQMDVAFPVGDKSFALPPGRSSRSYEGRSEEHTSELQSRPHLVCRLLLEKKKNNKQTHEPLPA